MKLKKLQNDDGETIYTTADGSTLVDPSIAAAKSILESVEAADLKSVHSTQVYSITVEHKKYASFIYHQYNDKSM